MSLLSQATRTYTSFGGVDIYVAFDDRAVDTLQGITISITREKAPTYIMGTVHPVSVTRGKRGLAGTMSFVHFDREPLSYLMTDPAHYYYAHADEVNWLIDAIDTGTENQYDENGALIINAGSVDQNAAFGVSQRTAPMFLDQVQPFDATMIAQNEYGNGAWSSILGIEVINEGSGLSTDTSPTRSPRRTWHSPVCHGPPSEAPAAPARPTGPPGSAQRTSSAAADPPRRQRQSGRISPPTLNPDSGFGKAHSHGSSMSGY